jgi:hypothetical protein
MWYKSLRRWQMPHWAWRDDLRLAGESALFVVAMVGLVGWAIWTDGRTQFLRRIGRSSSADTVERRADKAFRSLMGLEDEH